MTRHTSSRRQVVYARFEQQVTIVWSQFQSFFILRACLGTAPGSFERHPLQIHCRHKLWILLQQLRGNLHRAVGIAVLGKANRLVYLLPPRRLGRMTSRLRLGQPRRRKESRSQYK